MQYEKLRELIESSNNIVFFGGAGVSTESNIPDFRSDKGLYQTEGESLYPPETILSHSFFINHTEEFYRYYKTKMIYRDARPNPAHIALAELEKQGRLKAVVTQNIDGLHQMAGSRNVYELHGSVQRNYCISCKERYDLDYIINSEGIVPRCSKCNGIVRPEVVLYEEMLDDAVIEGAVNCISGADMIIVGGTSLVVYPAAGLIRYYRGRKLVLINRTPTQYDNKASLVINDSIGRVLQSAVLEAGNG